MFHTLNSIQPSVPTDPSWNYFTCAECSTNFAYYLSADWTTWQTWAYQVAQPAEYDVPYKTALNEEKFSAFILMTRCVTAADWDGCIFKSKSHGAIAYLANTGHTALETYRLTETQFKAIFTDATLSTDQGTTYGTAS